MAKTLVVPAHQHGPLKNGTDGCFARSIDGMCPGIKTAEWLNGLGDDDASYGNDGVNRTVDSYTNGDVRLNWIKGNAHVVTQDSTLLELKAELRRTYASVRYLKRRIKEVEAV